jgi:hypothetical protein
MSEDSMQQSLTQAGNQKHFEVLMQQLSILSNNMLNLTLN